MYFAKRTKFIKDFYKPVDKHEMFVEIGIVANLSQKARVTCMQLKNKAMLLAMTNLNHLNCLLSRQILRSVEAR